MIIGSVDAFIVTMDVNLSLKLDIFTNLFLLYKIIIERRYFLFLVIVNAIKIKILRDKSFELSLG